MFRIARKTALALIASLIFGSMNLPFASAAVAKAGKSCPVKGTTQNVGNLKFTCILKNKKLVWNQGVITKNPSPAVPKVEITKIETPRNTSDLFLTTKPISEIAWDITMKELAKGSTRNFTFKTIIGENTKPDILNPDYSKYTPDYYINEVYKLFNTLKTPLNIDLIYGSFKDREWTDNLVKKYCGVNCGDLFTQFCDFTNQVCGGGFYVPHAIFIAASTTPWRIYTENIGTTEAHEFTHAIQWSVFKDRNPSNFQNIPRWFSEGEANLNQQLFGGDSNNVSPNGVSNIKIVAPTNSLYEFKVNRSAQIAMLQNSPKDSATLLDFLNADNSEYFQTAKWSQRQVYYYGALVVEALRSIKGPSAELELIDQIASGANFEEAFLFAYKEDWNKAKVNLANYLSQELSR